MKAIYIKNVWRSKIAQALLKMDGYSWSNGCDFLNFDGDSYPLYFYIDEDDKKIYHGSSLREGTEVLELENLLVEHEITISDVSTSLVPHVKNVAKELNVSINKKKEFYIFNKGGSKKSTLNVNEFLDSFDDNLLFKKTEFYIHDSEQYRLLRTAGENFEELVGGMHKFDTEKWHWFKYKSSRNNNGDLDEIQSELINVRNLSLIKIDGSEEIRIIRTSNQSIESDFVKKCNGNTDVITSFYKYKSLHIYNGVLQRGNGIEYKIKVYNLVNYDENPFKIALPCYFYFKDDAYFGSINEEQTKYSGVSASGEAIEVDSDSVEIVTKLNNVTGDYLLFKGNEILNTSYIRIRNNIVIIGDKSYYKVNKLFYNLTDYFQYGVETGNPYYGVHDGDYNDVGIYDYVNFKIFKPEEYSELEEIKQCEYYTGFLVRRNCNFDEDYEVYVTKYGTSEAYGTLTGYSNMRHLIPIQKELIQDRLGDISEENPVDYEMKRFEEHGAGKSYGIFVRTVEALGGRYNGSAYDFKTIESGSIFNLEDYANIVCTNLETVFDGKYLYIKCRAFRKDYEYKFKLVNAIGNNNNSYKLILC